MFKKVRISPLLLPLFTVLALTGATNSFATMSAAFSLSSPSDFQAALDDGRLVPVDSWNSGLELAYPGEGSLFQSPILSVDANGLALDFETIEGDTVISAFNYMYPEDPKYTKDTQIYEKLVFKSPTEAGASVSIHLISPEGSEVTVVPLPVGLDGIELDFKYGDVRWDWTGNFKLDNVIGVGYDIKLKGVTEETASVWYTHVEMVPEPMTVSLLGLGCLLLRRRKLG